MDNEFQIDKEAWISRKLDSGGTCITRWMVELMDNQAEEVKIYTWWRIKMKPCNEEAGWTRGVTERERASASFSGHSHPAP